MKSVLAITLLLSLGLGLEAKKISFAEAKSKLNELQIEVQQLETEIAQHNRKLDKMDIEARDFPKTESHSEAINLHNSTIRDLTQKINTLPKKLSQKREELNKFIQEIGGKFKINCHSNGTYELSGETMTKPDPIHIREEATTPSKK